MESLLDEIIEKTQTRNDLCLKVLDSGRYIYSNIDLLENDIELLLIPNKNTSGFFKKEAKHEGDIFTTFDLKQVYRSSILLIHPDKIKQIAHNDTNEIIPSLDTKPIDRIMEKSSIAFDSYNAAWNRIREWVDNGCLISNIDELYKAERNKNKDIDEEKKEQSSNQFDKFESPIHEEVDLDDMDYIESTEDGNEGYFTYPCRCSGSYLVNESQLEDGVEFIGCNQCSFVIKIIYQINSDTD